MRLDVAVCLPLEAPSVALVREIVRNALRSFGVTQECIEDIALALSEACTNVIDHAVADDEYEVRLEVGDENCVVSVKNTGLGFDAGTLRDVMPDPSSPRGRGVSIMRALMDKVDFTSEPEAGTIVRLTKALSIEVDPKVDRSRRGREVDLSGRDRLGTELDLP
ncbi:MAG: ATP-binding protein [Actinobacteria bacterium]|nr:ATP-binding protein [Actinomycetota bacterium]